MIPNALQMGNEGHFVWVVDEENKVSKLAVEAASQNADKVVIASGLSANQRVVTDGVDRLTQGAKVEIVLLAPLSPKAKTTDPVVARSIMSEKSRYRWWAISFIYFTSSGNNAVYGRDFISRNCRLSYAASVCIT